MGRILDSVRAKSSILFWIETGAGGIAVCVFLVTLAWPEWIEAVFGIDPDGGSGEAEWAITAALLAFAAVMFLAARREWKRATIAGGLG